jgi:hypothetical protein
MSGGTFMVSRGIWDHEEFMPSPFSEREAFLWLISEASWKPRRKRVGKVVVDLDRGQLAHSTRFLADAWDWSHSKVRRFLDRLENRHMIRRASGTGVSVICVVNYDTYQASAQASDTAAAHKATQQRHSSGTNEKKDEIRDNKDITDTSVSVTRTRGRKSPNRLLPDGWVPDLAKAQSLMAELELSRDEMNYCYQQMKDHAHAKDRRLANWDQGFAMWVRKAVQDGDIGPNSRARRSRVSASAFDF